MWRDCVILGLLTGLAVLLIFLHRHPREHFNMVAQVLAERKNADVSKMDADLEAVDLNRPPFMVQPGLQDIGNSPQDLKFLNLNRSY